MAVLLRKSSSNLGSREKHFEQFLWPEGTVDEDILGELSSRVQVELRVVVTAMLYSSAGNWHHFFQENVINGKVGNLSGGKYCTLTYAPVSPWILILPADLYSMLLCLTEFMNKSSNCILCIFQIETLTSKCCSA